MPTARRSTLDPPLSCLRRYRAPPVRARRSPVLRSRAEPPFGAALELGVDEDRDAHDEDHPDGHRVPEPGVVDDVAAHLDADQERDDRDLATGQLIRRRLRAE